MDDQVRVVFLNGQETASGFSNVIAGRIANRFDLGCQLRDRCRLRFLAGLA
jgi:hypothetical protein